MFSRSLESIFYSPPKNDPKQPDVFLKIICYSDQLASLCHVSSLGGYGSQLGGEKKTDPKQRFFWFRCFEKSLRLYSFRDFSRDPQNPLPIRIHILFPYFEGFLWEGSSMGSCSLEYPLIPCRLRAIPNGFGLVSLADLQTDTEPEVKSLI